VPVVTVVIACTLYYTFIRRAQFFVYLCYQWDADKMKSSPLGWACRRLKHIIKTHSGSFRLMNVSYNHQHATSSCGKTRTATTAADRSIHNATRSTATVHTTAKVRLTSIAIRIRIRIRIRIPYSDRHQHLISCSLALCQLSLKISCKSVGKFSHKVANKQTD